MRLLLLSFLLASAGVVASADDNVSLSGKWQVDRNAAGRESKQECTFTHKNDELSGTCNSDRGPVQISGKVEGKKVTWTYKSDSEGGPVTVVYKGTMDSPGKMVGTVTAVEFGIEGEFKAVQAK